MSEKYEYQGETYYYRNGHWTDKYYIIVPMAISSQLDHTFKKKAVRPIRRVNRGYNVWIRILPGCYGARG